MSLNKACRIIPSILLVIAFLFCSPLNGQDARPTSGLVDHQKMEKILKRHEFVLDEQPSLWDIVLARLADWIKKLLNWLPAGDSLYQISRYFLILCLVLLVGFIVYLIFRFTRRDSQPQLNVIQMTADEIFLRKPAYYIKLAEEALQKGEFPLALRNYFYAILSALHHSGVILYDPSRTNWEYWNSFRNNNSSREDLQSLRETIRIFENCWYGNAAADAQSAAVFRQTAESFVGKFQ